MKRLILRWLLVFAAMLGTAANAAVVLESSTLEGRIPNCCGYPSIFSENYSGVGNPQWLGVRFNLTQETHVTGIGGLLGIDFGQLFATVVQLSSPTALPTGDPFALGTVKFAATLSGVPAADNFTQDYILATDFFLGAGSYGLIFGAGDLSPSSTGFGGMHLDPAKDLIGASQYFFYGNQGFFPGGAFWRELGIGGTRFVVLGDSISTVPEPESYALVLLGLGLILISRNTRRQHKSDC